LDGNPEMETLHNSLNRLLQMDLKGKCYCSVFLKEVKDGGEVTMYLMNRMRGSRSEEWEGAGTRTASQKIVNERYIHVRYIYVTTVCFSGMGLWMAPYLMPIVSDTGAEE
jgi:hypothetical protein